MRLAKQNVSVLMQSMVNARMRRCEDEYDRVKPVPSATYAARHTGHFGMSARNVRHVIAGGRIALRDRVAQTCDERAVRLRAQSVSKDLFDALARIPAG